MSANGETVDLAEWIIDKTYLVIFAFFLVMIFSKQQFINCSV